jgi:hypothetical protein
VIVLGLILTLLLQGGVFTSVAEGQRWTFAVGGPALERSPRWREADDAPPLAARAAIRSARAMLGALVKAGGAWELGRVSLQPIAGGRDAWVYLVDFASPLRLRAGAGAGSALREQMTLVVLMDGTAVTPVRRAAPRR